MLQVTGDCPSCGVASSATFEYSDAVNPLLATAMIDGRGLRTEMTYNVDGQLTRMLEAVGTPQQRDKNWTYDPTFRSFPNLLDQLSTSGGAARRQSVMTYDTQGNLTTETISGVENGGAFSLATVRTYNAGGQPLTVDPPGNGTADSSSFTYDPARGNGALIQLTRTDPLVGTTQFAYDPLNRRTSVTDVNGVQTVTAYDLLNRPSSVTQKGTTTAGDLVTTYSYTPLGDLFQVTLPQGNLIEYGYDAVGRLVTVERKPSASVHGERTLYTLDAVGHVVKEEQQRWTGSAWTSDAIAEWLYSTRCHLDKMIAHDGTAPGAVTEYAYDCDDNVQKVWDPNHPSGGQVNPATQTFAYDALNRVTSVIQPWAGAGGGTKVTSYTYDVQDHLATVVDPNGNTTTYTYGDRDLLTRQVSPVTGTTSYGYNEHGDLTSQADARGIVTNRSYDVLDRVTAITYPDTALNTTLAYDVGAFAKGRLTSTLRQGQTVAYGYDRFGRTLQDGGLVYSYDKNGNRTALAYPGGAVATYGFDYADRESTLGLQVGTGPLLSLAGPATYAPAGPLTSLPFGNGLTETRTFDPRYSPQSIRLDGTSTLLNWLYTVDHAGNISTITDALSAANNRTYGYLDTDYFLSRGDGPWGTRSWTYDKLGNRLSETRSGVTDTYSYVPNGPATTAELASIALGTGGTRTYAYDAAGNTIQIVDPAQQLDLLYDASNRLSRLRTVPTQASSDLAYDSRGFLATAQADDNTCAPIRTAPVYSSDGRLHRWAHLDSANAAANPLTTSDVLYFAGRPVALYGESGATSTLTYLTTDHLGTPTVATRDNSTLLFQGGFEPSGKDWNGAQAAGVYIRFPGQWVDGGWEVGQLSTAISLNVNRWYEPQSGRYTQAERFMPLSWRDPHLFNYSRQRPTALTDPLGLFVVDSSCDCSPSPPDNIYRAISQARQYPFGPKCQAILEKYRVLSCVVGRFGRTETGKGPTIKCQNNPPGNNACGETTDAVLDVPQTIHLYTGASSCPRNKPGSGLAITVFHETVHSCGIRDEQPVIEITAVCTGW